MSAINARGLPLHCEFMRQNWEVTQGVWQGRESQNFWVEKKFGKFGLVGATYVVVCRREIGGGRNYKRGEQSPGDATQPPINTYTHLLLGGQGRACGIGKAAQIFPLHPGNSTGLFRLWVKCTNHCTMRRKKYGSEKVRKAGRKIGTDGKNSGSGGELPREHSGIPRKHGSLRSTTTTRTSGASASLMASLSLCSP